MEKIIIEDLIPHRHPMLLVDEVLHIDSVAKKITARKTIKKDEFFVQGHYPEFPLVPGVISCECIFQTGAILLAYLFNDVPRNARAEVPVIAKINSAKFIEMIRPGDEVTLSAEIYEHMGQAYYLKGTASVGGSTRVKVDFVCMAKSMENKNT